MANIIIGSRTKKEANSKHYKITVVVDNDPTDQVASVELSFQPDNSKPAPNPSTMLLTKGKVNGSFKTFEYKKLNFEGGSPIGLTYTVESTMKDASKNPIGATVQESTTVEDNAGVTVSSMTLRLNADGTSFTFQTVTSGDLSKVHHAVVTLHPIDPDPNDRNTIIGSAASPDTYTCAVTKLTSKVKVFGNDNVTFLDSTKVAYYTYQANLVLYDSSNVVVDELIDNIIAEE